MCSTDGDFPEICHDTNPVARKEHKCSECRRIISIGEKYKRMEGKWDRKWQTYKTCQHCQIPQSWLEIECGGYELQGLFSEIIEHADYYQRLDLYRAAVGIKRGWRKFKKEGLMDVMNLLKENNNERSGKNYI